MASHRNRHSRRIVPFIFLFISFTNYFQVRNLNFSIFQNFVYDIDITIADKISNITLQLTNDEQPESIEPGIDYTSLNKEKENPSSDKEKPIHKFPPIVKGSVRVFITACGKETNLPQFDYASVTYARCNIMDSKQCHEAPYMLDFLYNWYDNLTEETIVFSHGHLVSWHMPNIVQALKAAMNTDYFKQQPFGGFSQGYWKKCCDQAVYQDMYSYMYNGTTVPRVWNRYSVYPCCATFFVKTSQIRKRPKEDYLTIYKNIENWVKMNPKLAYHCGRIFEYTWHILLTDNKTEIPTPPYVRWLISRPGPCPFNRTDI